MSGNHFYIPEMGEGDQQQSTTIEIENPEHPRTFPHREKEVHEAGYEAALWAKRAFNGERDMLVCSFLAAVEHEAETGENVLEDFVAELREEMNKPEGY
jgi:hypothetical protein